MVNCISSYFVNKMRESLNVMRDSEELYKKAYNLHYGYKDLEAAYAAYKSILQRYPGFEETQYSEPWIKTSKYCSIQF